MRFVFVFDGVGSLVGVSSLGFSSLCHIFCAYSSQQLTFEEYIEAKFINNTFIVCQTPRNLIPEHFFQLTVSYNLVNFYFVATLGVEKGFSGSIIDVFPRHASIFSNTSVIVNIDVGVALSPGPPHEVSLT